MSHAQACLRSSTQTELEDTPFGEYEALCVQVGREGVFAMVLSKTFIMTQYTGTSMRKPNL